MEDNEYYFCIKGLIYSGPVNGEDYIRERIPIFRRGTVYSRLHGLIYSKFNHYGVLMEGDVTSYIYDIITPFNFNEHFRLATDQEIMTQNHIDALNYSK